MELNKEEKVILDKSTIKMAEEMVTYVDDTGFIPSWRDIWGGLRMMGFGGAISSFIPLFSHQSILWLTLGLSAFSYMAGTVGLMFHMQRAFVRMYSLLNFMNTQAEKLLEEMEKQDTPTTTETKP